MSPRFPQLLLDVHAELIVDLFAGGGGASVGIEMATGRQPDVAINHDAAAVALHQANHPQTHHLVSDVFEVDPRAVTKGRPIGLLWASPDCTFHSKARGAKPFRSKETKRRALAWVVTRWAGQVRPRVIMLENVEEFAKWCPLVGPVDAQRPDPKRTGRTFRKWVRSLERLGYVVEHRELRACDYGAPTIRKRLFIADIAMRMLQPRELYNAQGFHPGYIIDRGADGRRLTKTEQVRMVGNSVSPPQAAALVRSNVPELIARDEVAA